MNALEAEHWRQVETAHVDMVTDAILDLAERINAYLHWLEQGRAAGIATAEHEATFRRLTGRVA